MLFSHTLNPCGVNSVRCTRVRSGDDQADNCFWEIIGVCGLPVSPIFWQLYQSIKIFIRNVNDVKRFRNPVSCFLVFPKFKWQHLQGFINWTIKMVNFIWRLQYTILIVALPCILISTKLFFQQMHLLLKHKMLQFIFKISFLIWLLHVSVSSDHHQGAYDGTLLKLQSL